MDRLAVANSARDDESVAVTVNVVDPEVVGVPETAPVEVLRLRPAGREPDVIDQA
jgi:hypothetical protein